MLDEEVGRILDISSEGSCHWWLYAFTEVFLFFLMILMSSFCQKP